MKVPEERLSFGLANQKRKDHLPSKRGITPERKKERRLEAKGEETSSLTIFFSQTMHVPCIDKPMHPTDLVSSFLNGS